MNATVSIDSKTLETLISPSVLIPHLLSTLPSLSSQINSPPRLSYTISQSNLTADNLLLIMPSWSTTPSLPYIGLKILTSYPQSSPSLSSTFSLFNSLTGIHLASIDASSLTNLRTASVSALAATFLAPPDSEVVLIVGCGSLAPYLVDAYRTAFPLVSRFVVWNRDKDKSVALASHCRDSLGNADDKVIYEHTENLNEAIKAADIIVCATGSNTPLVKGQLIKDGAHLNLVGSFKKDMKECDDEAIGRGRVFVDVEAAVEEAGELVGAIERGVIGKKDIIGTLVDLVGGKVVGRKDGKVAVFKSVGSAVFDLLAAQLAYESYMKVESQHTEERTSKELSAIRQRRANQTVRAQIDIAEIEELRARVVQLEEQNRRRTIEMTQLLDQRIAEYMQQYDGRFPSSAGSKGSGGD